LKSKRSLASILFLTLLLTAFNNCSPLPNSKAYKTSSNGRAYNGSGHSGKLTFFHYSEDPLCQPTSLTAESSIEIYNNKIQLFENQCSTSTSTNLSASELFRNLYDPYYLVHDELVYVNKSVVAAIGPQFRIVIHSFCYNPNYVNQARGIHGIDFAVRHEKTLNADHSWATKTYGHAIYGKANSDYFEVEMPGRIGDAGGPFQADSGLYQLDYDSHTSPSQGTATLRIDTGERIPVSCYYLHPKGAADPN
jgi:hypothetical protein